MRKKVFLEIGVMFLFVLLSFSPAYAWNTLTTNNASQSSYHSQGVLNE